MRVMNNSKTLFESFQENLNIYDKLTEADENLKLIFDSEDEAYIGDTSYDELAFENDWEEINSIVNDQINDYLILVGSAKEWDRGGSGYKVKDSLEAIVGNNDGVRVYTDSDNNLFLYCFNHDGNVEGQLFTFVDDYSDKAEKLLQDYYEDEDFSMYYFLDWLDGGTMKVLQDNGLLKPIKNLSSISESDESNDCESDEYCDLSDKDIILDIIHNFKDITNKDLKDIFNYSKDEENGGWFKQDVVDETGKSIIEYLTNKGLDRSRTDDLLYKLDDELTGYWSLYVPDNINEQDSLVRIVTSQQEDRDYSITDITKLSQVSDGDVLPPLDIAELLVDVDSRLTESVGDNWGQINFQSTRFNKDTNDSNALFELCVEDKTYLMSMLLEENGTLLKVNNTKGKTIFKRKSNDIVGLAESYIRQFLPLNEADKTDKTECDEKPLKERLEKAIKKNEVLSSKSVEINYLIDLSKEIKDDGQFFDLVQKKIYAFVAELHANVTPCMPTEKDEQEFVTFDKMVEALYGKDFVEVHEDEPKQVKGTETLKEADEQDSDTTGEEVPDTEEPKSGLGTGYAKFVRKPKSLEDLDNKAKYFTEGESSYLIVSKETLSEDEFNRLTSSFGSPNKYCKEFEPLDSDNYAFNVIEFSCEGKDYKLLVDPSGFDYCRYVAKVGGNE